MAHESASIWENAWISTSQFPFHLRHRGTKWRDAIRSPFVGDPGSNAGWCYWCGSWNKPRPLPYILFSVYNSWFICYWPLFYVLISWSVVKLRCYVAPNRWRHCVCSGDAEGFSVSCLYLPLLIPIPPPATVSCYLHDSRSLMFEIQLTNRLSTASCRFLTDSCRIDSHKDHYLYLSRNIISEMISSEVRLARRVAYFRDAKTLG